MTSQIKFLSRWYFQVKAGRLNPYLIQLNGNQRRHFVPHSHKIVRLSAHSHFCNVIRFAQYGTFDVHSEPMVSIPNSIFSKLKPGFSRTYCKIAGVQEQGYENTSTDELFQLAKDIKLKAVENDKMASAISAHALLESLKILTGSGLSVEECLSLADDPIIVQNLPDFTDVFSVLKEYGFPDKTVIKMIRQVPDLLSLKVEDMTSKLESLRETGIGVDSVCVVVPEAPRILLEDVKDIESKIKNMREFFSANKVIELFEKSPELFLTDIKETEEKIKYALFKMDASYHQIIQSNLCSHTLKHIETRHMFAVRTGFFRTIKKKKGQPNTNPPLKDIIDTSDEEFAKKFGSMTVQDYETFKKLFHREKKLELNMPYM